ncbi:MAG: DNA-binding protein [Dysgonamonadaceae bacterium]|nr:DNA-binding protein [Dysgonamonadaceae bacterium]
MKTISFNELRRIKDSLPSGSTRRIASELGLTEEAVRNYFGGVNQSADSKGGVHIEPGPDGGIVILDDSAILEKALVILGENSHKIASVEA